MSITDNSTNELWLNSGYSANGYYQPTLSGDYNPKLPLIFELRNTIYSSLGDVYLGEVTDYDQVDIENPDSNVRFVEYRTPEGELRYIRKDSEAFGIKFKFVPIGNMEATSVVLYEVKKTLSLGILLTVGIIASVAVVGYKLYQKYSKKK